MNCGTGNTALVLYALAHLPPEDREQILPNIERGFRFLLSNLDEQGFVRAPDGSVDYPTYATALTLTALSKLKPANYAEERTAMLGYLQHSQQTMRQGWTENDSDFGGWNQTGDGDVNAKVNGQTNLAVTTVALEALAASGGLNDAERENALRYLARCQNYRSGEIAADTASLDGGFYFTPLPDDPLNKAGYGEEKNLVRANSYATTTADGIAALLDCGVKSNDQRLQAAAKWLQHHTTADRVAGIPDDEAHRQYQTALTFYQAAALARAQLRAPNLLSSEFRSGLVRHLEATQRADGSWHNAIALMREDDPLIATPLAIVALAAIYR